MRHTITSLGLSCLLLAAAESAEPPRLPWLQAAGPQIQDERGKPVVLKGLFITNNIWGEWQHPLSEQLQAQGKPPLISATELKPWLLRDDDFDQFSKLTLNLVTYDLNYELFAAGNPKRRQNLDLLEAHVRRFNGLGIYVIIHFAAGPGIDVNDHGYYSHLDGRERPATIFESDEFRDQHIEFITYVVKRFVNTSGVAGFMLVDEPVLPSEADGGLRRFADTYNRFGRAIRKLDRRHIIFAQGYNARETNPGERYWDNREQRLRTDAGEQGISFDRDLVRLDPRIGNVVYDTHTFEPYPFTIGDTSTFDADEIEQKLLPFIRKAREEFNAPLLVSSYGVNGKQDSARRVDWLNAIHAIFDKHGLSACYFSYKHDYSPDQAVDPYYGIFRQANQGPVKVTDPEVLRAMEAFWVASDSTNRAGK